MLARRLELHQVHDVDDPNLEVRQVLPEQRDRRQRFERRHVAGAGHHDVGLAPLVAARPLPDPDAGRAVLDGGVHVEVLEAGLLAGHDDVHVVPAAQAMVGDRQQGVRVGRQVDPDHVRLLVDHVIDEAGILMREPVVVLAPDVRGEQIVERGDRPAPGDLVAHLQPFRVLVEHRVHDVDERLVAGEEAVAPGEEIAFEPALAGVLAQDLHDPAVRAERLVLRHAGRPARCGRSPRTARPGDLTRSRRARRRESCAVLVQPHDVAQRSPPSTRVASASVVPGFGDVDRVVPEVRHPQILQEQAAVGMRVGAHAACPGGASAASSGTRRPDSSNSSSGR